jgi:hypothetical protein
MVRMCTQFESTQTKNQIECRLRVDEHKFRPWRTSLQSWYESQAWRQNVKHPANSRVDRPFPSPFYSSFSLRCPEGFAQSSIPLRIFIEAQPLGKLTRVL